MGALHFLLVLAGCALMCGGIWLIVRSIRSDRHRPGPTAKPPELGVYELAFLAAGPSRVAETAVAVLVDDDVLRVARGGVLHAVADAARPSAAVERALAEAVRSRHGGLDAGEARKILMAGPQIGALRQRLATAGLVHRPSGSGAIRVKLTLLLAVPVLAAGLSVAGAFAFLLAPDGYLGLSVLTVAATGVVGFGCHAFERRALRDTCTPTGRRALRQAEQRYARRGDLAHLVALYGLEAVEDPRFEELTPRFRYEPSHTPSVVGAAGCGSIGDSGPSGDGGGASCGGGGCGGGS